MRTDRTHYTVPEREAYDIELNPPPPGMIVNCFSCYGVQTKGRPDKHTVAWSPLDRIPASAKRRALEMISPQRPEKPSSEPLLCDCNTPHKGKIGEHHHENCYMWCPF